MQHKGKIIEGAIHRRAQVSNFRESPIFQKASKKDIQMAKAGMAFGREKKKIVSKNEGKHLVGFGIYFITQIQRSPHGPIGVNIYVINVCAPLASRHI